MKAKSVLGYGVISSDEFVHVTSPPNEEEIEKRIHDAAVKLDNIQGIGYDRARASIEFLRAQFDNRDVVHASVRSAIKALADNRTPPPYVVNVGMRSGRTSFLKAFAESAKMAGLKVVWYEPNRSSINPR